MTARVASMRNRRYNTYVPSCGYAADVIHGAPYQVDFGTPAAAVATGILNATSIATAVDTNTFVSDTADAPFGRNITVVASGAATSNVTVYGKDYMGQPMTESFTLNGNTPVVGRKAFKWVDRITAGVTAATTINVGFGARVGLPYRMSQVLSEIGNGAGAAVGTLTAPDLTDPQTATTLDPRGLYTPTTALNGSNRILASFLPYNIMNANGNGGLYGLKHA
ncbi:MAG TPA: hypothetical protein VLG09_04050 [Candidatus Saccharimonadales bacterium]|nr:hypothetical protein [Candidatus Saccharimonadales bacterium]